MVHRRACVRREREREREREKERERGSQTECLVDAVEVLDQTFLYTAMLGTTRNLPQKIPGKVFEDVFEDVF